MIAIRIFLYVTVPLLILGILKGGELFSVSFFELLMYVFLLGIYSGVLIAYFKKKLHELNTRVLKIGIACIFLVWGTITISFLFFRSKICMGYDPCDLITIPKILVTLLLALLPIVLILTFRTYNQHKKDTSIKS